MAFQPTSIIEVRAWGKTVGALAPGRTRNAYVFEYDTAWIRLGVELAPVSMPLVTRRYAFANLPSNTYQGLPPSIADSLPDKFGNSIVDAWLARNGVQPGQVSALDRLAYLGDRGLGALEFKPDYGNVKIAPSALDIRQLVMSARDAVAGRLGEDASSQEALQQIISVGTSAGGARAKAVVNVNRATGEIRPGHVSAPAGFEAWLLKFDGIGKDHQLGESEQYGRIEYAYSLMARAAGITMSETDLLEENGRAHFMTRRFDRTADGEKLHMQSLCALATLDFNAIGVHDYAQYQGAIRELGLGPEARAEAFRRMVFNVVAANCDDHTKNFGFLMGADGKWSLAPAYDITHAYNPAGQWTHQHLMSVNGKFAEITRKDILTAAERHGVYGATAIISEVNMAVRSWSEFAKSAGVSAATAKEVAADLREVEPARTRRRSGIGADAK